MKKIPCRLCPRCGKYSSLNVDSCSCGESLSAVAAAAVDAETLPASQVGRIDDAPAFYVRKCPVCSTEHFFTEATGSVRVCRNCHKTRIAQQPTLPFEAEEKKPAPAKETVLPVSPVVTGGAWGDDDDDDDDEDFPGGAAFGQMRDNIRAGQEPSSAGLWGGLLAGKGLSAEMSGIREPGSQLRTPQSAAPKADPRPVSGAGVSTLTATAVRYGQLSFTLRSDSRELPYLLGRSAGHAAFLRQDPRVGNEHCYLAFRAGNWMVIEKRAINGTAVNGVFLPEGGSQVLHDGDELMLGHHADSMAFRITIKA